MTAADPPPGYTDPLSNAGGVCRTCGRPWRFELRPGTAERDGKPLRCSACGTVLGLLTLQAAGMVWLCVVCAPVSVPVVDSAPP